MRGVAIALVLAVQLPARAAEAGAEDDVDVPGLAAPDLAGDALVWEDAAFYLEPWEGGASVRFSAFGRGRREEVGRAVPVRIVGASRTFVEIEPAPVLGCGIRRLEIDPRVEGLRLYVRRDDLAPVLVKPYAVTYSDGTGARLAAGMPVMPTASGLYAVSARGDKLLLAIPHTHVGYVTAHPQAVEPGRPEGAVVRVDRTPAAKLGGDSLEVRASWTSSRPAKIADPQLLRWRARCLELTVAVPAAAVRAATWSAPYRPASPSPATTKYPQHLLRGTPLATVGGREVAVAAGPIELAAPAGPTACFDARLTLGPVYEPPQGALQRVVKLCARAEHVVRGPAAAR